MDGDLPAFQLIILIIMTGSLSSYFCVRPLSLYSHSSGFQLTSPGEPYSPTMPCLVFFWARSTVPDNWQRSPR